MSDDQIRHGGRVGSVAGCGAAVIIAVVVAFPFLFAVAWGGSHREPVPQCQRKNERAFVQQLAVIAALAALLGAAVRAIVV
jgi:hypothetical protein